MRRARWIAGLTVLLAAACSPPNGIEYDAGDSAGGGGGSACPNDLPSSCPADAPGYAATVGPIVSALCADCHAPGGVASNLKLATYAEVYAARSSTLDQVYDCYMPPAGSGTLTLAQRQDLLAWLVCGAPDD
jgi:hypothetical protein